MARQGLAGLFTHAIDDLHIDIRDTQGLRRPALAVVQVDDALVTEYLRLLCREREDSFRRERALHAGEQEESRG